MKIITKQIAKQLQANRGKDNAKPVLKLFNPCGAETWLITEIGEDNDTMFGLCDMGWGCPELGYVRLSELMSIRLPAGLKIERDRYFSTDQTIMELADKARETGRISA